MPKKKGQNKQIPKDVTLGYYANVQKPGNKPKKYTSADPQMENVLDISWDQIPDDEDINIVKTINPDGTENFICSSNKKQNNHGLSNSDTKFNEYPEIVWYQVSRRLSLAAIGPFALINKTTYRITQQKSFWVHIYNTHCKNSKYLPERLKIEDWPKTYGLRTRTIKAVCCVHYIDQPYPRVREGASRDLIKHRCLNFWFLKTGTQWVLFFKFRSIQPYLEKKVHYDFLEELERIDANPEVHNKILQVNCKFFNQVHPVMGMTLTSVKQGLSKNLFSHNFIMGFNSASHVDRNILPEYTITLENVNVIMVYDWWHPNYPHFDIRYPWESIDREREEDVDEPVLDRDFFASNPSHENED